MSLRRTASFSTTALLIGAAVFAGSTSAATALGEPDGLYSASEDDGTSQFAQLDKTDASATLLGAGTDVYEFISVEVVDGVGYAVGLTLGPDDQEEDDDVPTVFTWNITTGAVLTAVPIDVAGDLERAYALDTRLDGVLITYLYFDGADAPWIASVDPVSGVATLLIDLDLFDDGRIWEGIATNPVDGITYALADYDDGTPAASPVDFGTSSVGDSIFYEQIEDTLGGGYFQEGDFDEAGVLWFTYSGSGAGVVRTNAPLEVAVDATELGDPDIESKAITIGSSTPVEPEPEPEPELAATGTADGAIAVVGFATVLLGLGAVLMLARRSRRA